MDSRQLADRFKDTSELIKKFGGIDRILRNKGSIQAFIDKAPTKRWKNLLKFMIPSKEGIFCEIKST